MCLHREAGAPAFSRDEQECLRQLGPHLAAGLRPSLLLTLALTAEGSSVPGVLIVTTGLELVSISAAAEAWLSEMHDGSRLGVRTLPIVSVVSRLVSIERAAVHTPAELPRRSPRPGSRRFLKAIKSQSSWSRPQRKTWCLYYLPRAR
jgi:hypothetical protein